MIGKVRFAMVPASKIICSSVLPPRKHGLEVAESVKIVGVQQPVIVRPFLDNSGRFELIDGHARLSSFKGDELVLVEVRFDAGKVSDVFRISEATFTREQRSPYEKSLFIEKWLDALKVERGAQEGLQAILAKEASISESAISQYLAIAELFRQLAKKAPTEEFSVLKMLSVDKLYLLSGLRDCNNLLEVVRLVEKNPVVTKEQAEEIVRKAKLMEKPNSQIPGEKPLINETVQASLQKKRAEKCRDSAEKITALVDETHERLVKIIKEVTNDSEKFSSDEVLQTLRNVFRTLTRLKKYSDALGERMWPDTGNTSATNPASPAS